MTYDLDENIMSWDGRWNHPSTCILAGPTGSGKSTMASRIVSNRAILFKNPPKNAFIIYANRQPIWDHLLKTGLVTKIFNELPSFENLKKLLYPYKDSSGCLLVLDDCLGDLSKVVLRIFTELSHHLKVTCLLLSQNLFYQDKIYRSLSLNCQILIVFKSPRDMTQIATLSRQMHPTTPNFLIQSFIDATKNGYGYMVINYHQQTPDILRLTTNVLPSELPIIVYVNKKTKNESFNLV